MIQQSTSTILMVRPKNFGYNEETAPSNAFQQKITTTSIPIQAIQEFDSFVAKLRENGIEVIVIEDTAMPLKPDAVFPNNWFSTHNDGTICLYPMCTPNRRTERRQDIIELLQQSYCINQILDISEYENQQRYLEGTGSIIFDHVYKIAYACISIRTNKELFETHCRQLGYKAMTFHSYDANKQLIYHTNVMMCMATHFCIVGLNTIDDATERDALRVQLEATQKKIITITQQQILSFAGNMLELRTINGELLLVMSASAYSSLSKEQKTIIEQTNRIIVVDITIIEKIGGGSVRCMMAEIFLSK